MLASKIYCKTFIIFLIIIFNAFCAVHTVFEDDFESENGWTTNPYNDDSATKGLWQRANPSGTTYQLDITPGNGYNDLVTDGRSGEDYSYDIDGGKTSILSSSIQLPSNSSITLTFTYYFAHRNDANSNDYFRIKVIGSSTQTVFQELGSAEYDYPSWETKTVDISSFSGQTVHLLVEACDGTDDGSIIEAGLDDVLIEAEQGSGLSTIGNTQVFSKTSSSTNRRAMPFVLSEDGIIESITIYHNGGTGKVYLGVYEGESLPDERVGVTLATNVNSSAGWQTIPLVQPVCVSTGTKIWLAWVFENMPGVRYQSGSPGRASSSQGWSGAMPDPFASSSTNNYIYSIYANYSQSPCTGVSMVGNTEVFGNSFSHDDRRAVPYYMTENGKIEDIVLYHSGGTGQVKCALYLGEDTPESRLAATYS